jgi:hypothetical protein
MTDNTPPTIHAAQLNYAAIGTAATPGTATLTVYASDDLSGVDYAVATWTSPSGDKTVTAQANCRPPNIAAALAIAATWPQYTETGTWQLSIRIVDAAGNQAMYDTATLAGANLPASITVT